MDDLPPDLEEVSFPAPRATAVAAPAVSLDEPASSSLDAAPSTSPPAAAPAPAAAPVPPRVASLEFVD